MLALRVTEAQKAFDRMQDGAAGIQIVDFPFQRYTPDKKWEFIRKPLLLIVH